MGQIFHYEDGSWRYIWKFLLLMMVIETINITAVWLLGLVNLSVNGYWTLLAAKLSIIIAVFLLSIPFGSSKPEDLGLKLQKGWFKNVALGALSAGLTVTLIFGLALGLGQVSIQGISAGNLAIILSKGIFLYLVVALAEEYMNRGFALKSLGRGYKYPIAILISALFFLALHLPNKEISGISLINTFIFGILTGYVFIKSGSLWWPIGFHAAWNIMDGVIFGLTSTGLYTKPLLNLTVKSGLLTGGHYGPAASLPGTVALLIILYIQWVKYRQRGEKI